MMRRRMVDRCACEAIGRPGWAVSGPMISFCTIPPRESEGAASVARPPLDQLHSGGGAGCREAELVFGGDGPYGPPPGYARQRGRRMPADRPITFEPPRARSFQKAVAASGIVLQALPSGRAT